MQRKGKRGPVAGTVRSALTIKYKIKEDQWYLKTGGVDTTWKKISHEKALEIVDNTKKKI